MVDFRFSFKHIGGSKAGYSFWERLEHAGLLAAFIIFDDKECTGFELVAVTDGCQSTGEIDMDDRGLLGGKESAGGGRADRLRTLGDPNLTPTAAGGEHERGGQREKNGVYCFQWITFWIVRVRV